MPPRDEGADRARAGGDRRAAVARGEGADGLRRGRVGAPRRTFATGIALGSRGGASCADVVSFATPDDRSSPSMVIRTICAC